MTDDGSFKNHDNHRCPHGLITKLWLSFRSMCLLCLSLAVTVPMGCTKQDPPDGKSKSGATGEIRVQSEVTEGTLPNAAMASNEAPLQDLTHSIPKRAGYCIQIRSVSSDEEAQRLKSEIEEKLDQPVVIFSASLGAKGTWFRICVGNWKTMQEAQVAADRWTASSGQLVPYMSISKKGQADYLVKEIGTLEPQFRLPKAMEKALLEFVPSQQRPVFFARTPNDDGPIGILQGPKKEDGSCGLVAMGRDGKRMRELGSLAPGCPSCDLALKKKKARCPEIFLVGDVGPWPGDEILIKEYPNANESVLVVLAQGAKGVLERRTAFWLDTYSEDFLLYSEPSIETWNGQGFLSFLRTEASLVKGQLCGLRQYSEFWQLLDHDRWGLHISKNWVLEEHFVQIPELIHALDQRLAFGEASRLCADASKGEKRGASLLFCLNRAAQMKEQGRTIQALNAAAMLSVASKNSEKPLALFQTLIEQAKGKLSFHANPERCFDTDLQLSANVGEQAKASLRAAWQQKQEINEAQSQPVSVLENAVFLMPSPALREPTNAVIKDWFALLKTLSPARASEIEALLTRAQLGEK